MLKTYLELLVSASHLDKYIDANLSGKKESHMADVRPNAASVASAGIINVIHDPMCSSILPSSYRTEI